MFPNRFALVALGVTCVAAAAGGGYLATRHNAAVQPAAAAAPTPIAEVPATGTSKPAVQETEAVVADPRPVDRAVEPKPASSRAAAASERRPAASARNTTSSPARRTEDPQRAPSGSAWPISTPANSQASSGISQPAAEPPIPQAPIDSTVVEASRAAEPPKEPEKVFEELVVSANSVLGLQLDGTTSSDRAEVEDRVEARVVREVRVGGDVAIPAGARALGSVMVVERGGKFKDRARLGIRFHTLVLADGTRLPITSETDLSLRRRPRQRKRGEDRRRRGRWRDPRRDHRRCEGRRGGRNGRSRRRYCRGHGRRFENRHVPVGHRGHRSDPIPSHSHG